MNTSTIVLVFVFFVVLPACVFIFGLREGLPLRRLAPIAGLLLAAEFGVVKFRPALALAEHNVKQREDVILIPPPTELKLLSLGYTSATVDYLWGKTLVEYGIHSLEQRPIDIVRYIDAIMALEPTYRPLYMYVDTLLVFRPPRGTENDARLARAYYERGIKERPFDHEVWMHYGQFVAFLAPSFLSSPEEANAWRRDGAEAIARAVELGGDADRALSVAGVLSRYGARDARIKHLQKTYALTDDPLLQARVMAELSMLQATNDQEDERKAFERDRKKHAPYMGTTSFLAIGPYPEPARCVGIEGRSKPECATTFPDARLRRRLLR